MILTDEQRAEASAELQKFWSNERRACPMLASDVDAFIVECDLGLRDAEAAINAVIPPGEIKDWLLADKATTRHAFTIVSRKRVQASGENPET